MWVDFVTKDFLSYLRIVQIPYLIFTNENVEIIIDPSFFGSYADNPTTLQLRMT
jgi:hypothetical protein